MKEYNCPDCQRTDSCEGCPRTIDTFKVTTPPYFPDSITRENSYIPSCCRNCSNHPSNGGSGICCCSLPYMTTTGQNTLQYYTTVVDKDKYTVTYTTHTVEVKE